MLPASERRADRQRIMATNTAVSPNDPLTATLDQLDQALDRLQRAAQAAAGDRERLAAAVAERDRLQGMLTHLKADYFKLEEDYRALTDGGAAATGAGDGSADFAALRDERNALKWELEQLQAEHATLGRSFATLKAQYLELQQQAEQGGGVDPAGADTRRERDALRADLERLRAERADQQQRLGAFQARTEALRRASDAVADRLSETIARLEQLTDVA